MSAIKVLLVHSWNPFICFSFVFQETDFVCFETGYDKFNNYDVDMLLSSSLEVNDDGENKGLYDQSQVAEDVQEETQAPADEAAGNEEQMEHHDNPEDLMSDDQSASKPEPPPDVETESASVSEVEFDLTADPEERPEEDAQLMQEPIVESLPEEVESENNETKDGATPSEEEATAESHISEKTPVTISEAAQIPKLKTKLGTTFDAAVTDEETTKNVTPFEEEEIDVEEKPPEDAADFTLPGETPLLSLSQEALTTRAYEDLRQQASSPAAPEDENENPEDKNLWNTFGDADFSVVTGGERTADYLSSDEEEDGEEKTALKITQSFEETPEDETLMSELANESEITEAVLDEPPPISIPNDEKETDDDSEKPSVDHTDEDDGDVTGPEEAREETSKPTGTITRLMDLQFLDSSAIPEPQNSDFNSAEEPGERKQEEEVFKDHDVRDKNANQESSNGVIDHSEDVVDEEADNKTDIDGEMDDSEVHPYPFTEEVDSDRPDEKLSENYVPEVLPDHQDDHLESNESQSKLPVEPPQVTEEPLPEELEDTADEEQEETKHLLEDENALSFSHSNITASEELSPEVPPPSLSTPEPEYSDSVMRLTLLRDHFTEEKMEQVQKLLGLKNLFKLEAMFSDLDTELQATRTHTGTTQDIENALEGILETSENTILDEIERMLDSQETKPNYDQDPDSSNIDEETEILDDFQELAFSLRQKYSTASDSTPLARELNNIQGWTVSFFGVDSCLNN